MKIYIKLSIMIFFIQFLYLKSFSQSDSYSIQVQVFDNNQKPLNDVFVQVLTDDKFFFTDKNGKGEIGGLVNKNCTIEVSTSGYFNETKSLKLGLGQNTLYFVLQKDEVTLDEIVIKSEGAKLKTNPIKAEVINIKELSVKASNVVEMMNLAPGIRIRQSGGLGSASNIMLNGFQGQTIRMFKDGIPLDYLYGSFGINNVPANSLERVEVFKGVLPTNLGADALGGAVNLVTRHTAGRELSLSYEIASFNTHRATLNSKITSKNERYFAGLDGFYNYSDNNYKVMAPVVHPETANVIPTKLPFFHNAYKQVFLSAYGGIKDLSWADELRIDFSGFYISRENQYAALMDKPLGKAHSKRNSFLIPTLRYKKNLFSDKVLVDQFFAFSSVNTYQIDTLRGRYDWFGKLHPPINLNTVGEARATLSKSTTRNFISRTKISYFISDNHNVMLNSVYQTFTQKGSDPYGATKNDKNGNPVDMMSLPSNYNKLIISAGLNSMFLDSKLENIAQIKYFSSNTEGKSANLSTGRLNDDIIYGSSNTFGYAESIKFNINENSFLRLSGELATRLPDQNEILGDGAYLLPNFNIKPERSLNSNLGYTINKANKYSFEFNSFYRNTRDMIVTETQYLIFSKHINVEQVRGYGLEFDASVYPFSWMRLNGNCTYQNFRLYELKDKSIAYLEGSRLPNIPFFFANLSINTNFNKVFSSKDQITAYWNFSYVHKYFLRYIPKESEPPGFLGLFGESKVNTKDIIPSQKLNSFGLTWTPSIDAKFVIGVEIKNVFDEAIFDNFRIQNAGRSFHLKVSYTL